MRRGLTGRNYLADTAFCFSQSWQTGPAPQVGQTSSAQDQHSSSLGTPTAITQEDPSEAKAKKARTRATFFMAWLLEPFPAQVARRERIFLNYGLTQSAHSFEAALASSQQDIALFSEQEVAAALSQVAAAELHSLASAEPADMDFASVVSQHCSPFAMASAQHWWRALPVV